MGLRITRGRVGRAVFPPEQVAEVKAIACELPRSHELPLSKFSRVELHRLVIERGVTEASASTIWRWLHEDAIKPWQTRSWIFPRDPDFAQKAGRALDLYARTFEGKRLMPAPVSATSKIRCSESFDVRTSSSRDPSDCLSSAWIALIKRFAKIASSSARGPRRRSPAAW